MRTPSARHLLLPAVFLAFPMTACSLSNVKLPETGSTVQEDSPRDTEPLPDESPVDSEPVVDDSEPPEDPVEIVDGLDCAHTPVFLIDTEGGGIVSDAKRDALLDVIRCHDGTLDDLAEAPRQWAGPIHVEIHGSSSSGYPKYNYRFETVDASGEDLSVGLLDLPGESDWVLHGPYCDKSLLRNALAYRIGRDVADDFGRWEPRTSFVELFIDGDYRGVYVLVERVKRDGDRLDLARVAASAAEGDLSGGYIVKIDQHRNEGWNTRRGTPIDYVYPRYDDITGEQQAYISAWFDAFEAALLSTGWDDPASGYAAWIDVDSWIDHYLLNELTANVDAYRLSAYLYKQADADGGKLFAGPLWDFDRAWGNCYYCYCNDAVGFIIDDLTACGCGYQFPFWWTRLLSDTAFKNRLRCRWEYLRMTSLSNARLLDRIGDLSEQVADIQPRDNERWHTIGTWIDPNDFVGATWGDELRFLETWLLDRAAWLDASLPGACAK